MELNVQAINTGGGAVAEKPAVMRVVLPSGAVRLWGVSEAARWLGCSRQCLSQIAHGTSIYAARKIEERARVEFPGLFSESGGCVSELN